ncbi:MAG: DUF4340 domain-containing protein [Ruminococcaceae bacterium]|nr:DUF4340 domain-containing protein [Oscillospiraceae bacterium]
MKKKTRNLIIALVILGVCIAGFFIVKALTKEDNEPSLAGEPLLELCSYEAADITDISYTNKYGDFNFTLSAGIWSYADDMGFPLDQTAFANLTTTISSLIALRDITDDLDKNADYGFDDPTLKLTVIFNDGKKQKFTVGDYNTNGQGYYLRTNDRTYISGNGLATTLGVPLFDLAKTTKIAVISSDTITSVSVNGEEFTEREWIDSFCEALDLVYQINCEDYKNYEKYGFDSTENKITVKYTLDTTTVMDDGSIIPATTDHEYTLSFVIKDDIQYLMLPDDKMVYSASGLDALLDIEASGSSITVLPEITE